MASEYITDPEILSQLEEPDTEDAGYVTDPGLLAQLEGGEAVAPQPRRSRAMDLATTLQSNKLFNSATTALQGAKDKGIRRRPDGDWDLPNIISQDGGMVDAVKGAVVSGISQKLGDRLPAPEQAPGRGEEIKAIQKVFHDFQQANNLSDEEMQQAWSDLGNTTREWGDDEKLRVLSDGSLVPNPQLTEWLDPQKAEQLISGASAPEQAKELARQQLPQAQANLASQKIASYEAAASIVNSAEPATALVSGVAGLASQRMVPPSEWAQQKGRNDVGTPQFVLDYEKEVVNASPWVAQKIAGLAGRGVLGFGKVANTILGVGGLAGIDKATELAGRGAEASATISQGLPATGLVGSIVEEAPSIGLQVATGRMFAMFGGTAAAAGVYGTAGLQSAGLTYADEISQGTPEAEAREKAAKAGISTGIITAMFGVGGAGGVERVAAGELAEGVTLRQVFRIAREQGIKNLAKSPELRELATGVAKAYAGEATEEGVDQFLQAFLTADPDDNLADAWSGAVEAFKVGGAIGTFVDVAQRAANDLAMGAVTGAPDSAKAAMEPVAPTEQTAEAAEPDTRQEVTRRGLERAANARLSELRRARDGEAPKTDERGRVTEISAGPRYMNPDEKAELAELEAAFPEGGEVDYDALAKAYGVKLKEPKQVGGEPATLVTETMPEQEQGQEQEIGQAAEAAAPVASASPAMEGAPVEEAPAAKAGDSTEVGDDLTLISETNTQIASRLNTETDRSQARNERKQAAVRIVDTLQPGDTVTDAGGNVLVVEKVIKGTGKVFFEEVAEPIDLALEITPGRATDASGNVIEVPSMTIDRYTSPETSTPTPDATQTRNQQQDDLVEREPAREGGQPPTPSGRDRAVEGEAGGGAETRLREAEDAALLKRGIEPPPAGMDRAGRDAYIADELRKRREAPPEPPAETFREPERPVQDVGTSSVRDRVAEEYEDMEISAKKTLRDMVNSGVLRGLEVATPGGKLLVTKPTTADSKDAVFRVTKISEDGTPSGHVEVSDADWTAFNKNPDSSRFTELGDLYRAAQMQARPDIYMAAEELIGTSGSSGEFTYRLRNREVAPGAYPKQNFIRSEGRDIIYSSPLSRKDLDSYELVSVGAKRVEAPLKTEKIPTFEKASIEKVYEVFSALNDTDPKGRPKPRINRDKIWDAIDEAFPGLNDALGFEGLRFTVEHRADIRAFALENLNNMVAPVSLNSAWVTPKQAVEVAKKIREFSSQPKIREAPEPSQQQAPSQVEPEPDMTQVFEMLRERQPATRTINTESPKFKELVTGLKDKRAASVAAGMAQRKAEIAEQRKQIEQDRIDRNNERLRRNRERAKNRPLDEHRKRIRELTKDEEFPEGRDPDFEFGLREWLRKRGYDASIRKKGHLDSLVGPVTPLRVDKREQMDALRASLTPEVKAVLEAIYRKPEKSKEQIPIIEAFGDTTIGEAILDNKLRSPKWYRDRKLPLPGEYDMVKGKDIPGHIQSRVFSEKGLTPDKLAKNIAVQSEEDGGSLNPSVEDIWQAVLDLADGKVATEEDYEAYMEKQQRDREDAELAFAEQQLEASGNEATQTVDLNEVREGDRFMIGGNEYVARNVVADDRGRTEEFTLGGVGPLRAHRVTNDFFAESVVPTEGSISHIDPAEIEAINIALEFPEDFEDAAPEADTVRAEIRRNLEKMAEEAGIEVLPEMSDNDLLDRLEGEPMPYSKEALIRVFNIPAERAEAMDVLVAASGLDVSRVVMVRGGTPGAGLRQDDAAAARDAEYLAAVEAGDMTKAQEMVDEAARAAGYTIGPVWHGTGRWGKNNQFTVFDSKQDVTVYRVDGQEVKRLDSEGESISYYDDEQLDDGYHYGALTDAATMGAEESLMFRVKEEGKDSPHVRDLRRLVGKKVTYSTEERRTGDGFYFSGNENYGIVARSKNKIRAYIRLNNPAKVDESAVESAGSKWKKDRLIAQGYDGAIFDAPWNPLEQVVAFHPSQIKSADPVTRRPDGSVIPLSERFNPESPSILYQAETPSPKQAAAEAEIIFLQSLIDSKYESGDVEGVEDLEADLETKLERLDTDAAGTEAESEQEFDDANLSPEQDIVTAWFRWTGRGQVNARDAADFREEYGTFGKFYRSVIGDGAFAIRENVTDAQIEAAAKESAAFYEARRNRMLGAARLLFQDSKSVTDRSPSIRAAAIDYRDGKITQQEYLDIVRAESPAKLFTSVPAPASNEDLQKLDKGKRPKIGGADNLPEGTRVGLRLDIPVLRDHGVGAVTIHQPRSSMEKGSAGSPIGYAAVARVRNARFATNSTEALKIATGEAKQPLATIEGEWVPATPAEVEAAANEAIKDPAWVQVGMNPIKHSWFYDRADMRPVIAAEEILQVGSAVFAKNPVYASPSDPRFMTKMGVNFQRSGRQGNKGSIEFLQDGRTLIRGLGSSDVSTAAHEFAHLIRRQLLNRGVPVEGITEQDIDTVEQWAGAVDGKWSVAAEEKFARGWERYLADGKAPVAKLQAVFDKFAKWLGDIYGRIAGSPIDIEITPEVRAVMDKLVTRNLEKRTETERLVELSSQVGTDLQPPQPEPWFDAPFDPEGPTSLKHAQTDADRARLGMPPRMLRPATTDQDAWDSAIAAEDAHRAAGLGGTAGAALLANLSRQKPRALTKQEHALLLHEKLVRQQEVEDANRALNRLGSDAAPETRLAAQARATAAQEAFDDLISYAEAAGSASGLSLQARKMLVNRDYTIATVVNNLKAAANKKSSKPVEWTEADQRKAVAMALKLQAAQERVDALEAENSELTATIEQLTADVEQAQRKLENKVRLTKARSLVKEKLDPLVASARARLEARGRIRPSQEPGSDTLFQSGITPEDAADIRDLAVVASGWFVDRTFDIAEFSAKLVADFGTWAGQHAGAIFNKARSIYVETAESVTGSSAPTPESVLESIDPELPLDRADVWALARAHVVSGLRGRTVLDAVFGDLSPLFPGLTREEVATLFTKYGTVVYPSNKTVPVELNRIRNLERIALKLEDVRAGRMPKRTGFQRGEQDAEVRELEKEFREALRESGLQVTDPARQLQTALGAAKRRMQNEIEELQRAIDRRVPRVPAPRGGIELDEEGERLKSQLAVKREEYAAIFDPKPEEVMSDAQRMATRTAEAWLARLSKSQSDTLEWAAKPAVNPMAELLAKHVKTPVPDFMDRAIAIGATEDQARVLDALISNERAIVERILRARAEIRNSPERRVELALRALDRQIAEEERMLAEGILSRPKGVPVSSPEIEEKRQRLAEMRANRRALREAQNPGMSALEQAKASARRSIERLTDMIARNDVAVKRKTPVDPDEELKALLDAREALSDEVMEMRKLLPVSPEKVAQEIQKALDASQRTLDKLRAKLDSGDLSKAPAKRGVAASDPAVMAVREQIKALNKELAARRRDALPKMSPEEAREKRLLGSIEKRRKELERRTRERDFRTKPKLAPVNTEAIRNANFELSKARSEYGALRAEYLLKNAPLGRQLWHYTLSTGNLLKLLTLGFDVGVLLRQLGTTPQSLVRDLEMFMPTERGRRLRANGSYLARTLRAGVAAFLDPKAEHDIYDAIMKRPNAGWDKAAGMVYGAPFDDQAGTREDIPTANFIETVPWWVWPSITGAKVFFFGMNPPFAVALLTLSLFQKKLLIALDRAQRAATNQSRAMWFDHAIEAMPGGLVSPVAAEQLGKAIMVGTGRGTLPQKMEGAVPALNQFFLATRFYLSRILTIFYAPRTAFDVLTNFRMVDPEVREARKEIAKMYGRSLAGRALMMTLAAMIFGKWDDEDEDEMGIVVNPFNPDFLRIRLSENVKLDFMSSVNGFMNVISRTVAGRRQDSETGVTEVYAPQDYSREVMNFVASKRNLTVSYVWNTWRGEYYGGKEVSLKNALEEATTAIIINDTVRAYEELGPVKGSMLLTLMLTGAGTSVGDSEQEKEANKEARAMAAARRREKEAEINE